MRLSLTGICATGLERVKGDMGFYGMPGHEFVGIAKAVADQKDRHWLNRRVGFPSSGTCHPCRAGSSTSVIPLSRWTTMAFLI
ncbi:MAG: alcohol dehydrogenase catalytic domain-containing protein [Gammaproteobacteria bacterium]